MTITLEAEDIARMRVSEVEALRLQIGAIRCVPREHWGCDDRFIGTALRCVPPQSLSDAQKDHVARIAWRLRKYLPEHLRPRVNPDDPIVREMREKERAAHG